MKKTNKFLAYLFFILISKLYFLSSNLIKYIRVGDKTKLIENSIAKFVVMITLNIPLITWLVSLPNSGKKNNKQPKKKIPELIRGTIKVDVTTATL